MQTKQTTVALSAFGASTVKSLGQERFVPVVASAGANGIEIRRELFEGEAGLETLRDLIEGHRLFAVYSAPMELWREDHRLDREALASMLGEAERLGARFLKVSLGHYGQSSPLPELAAALAVSQVRLLVENDQTPYGGRPAPLADFFAACERAGLPCGMTFDIGNWRWTDTDPAAAAEGLGRYVEYVHCKGVEASGGRLKAVPLEDEDASWRRLFRHFQPAVPRAIEFPLVGDDLVAVTRHHLTQIATA